MNISYNWLRELSGTKRAPRELAERLTTVGLAVDAVHEAGDDFVLEIDLTSNRPDCLSHLGVAREVSVFEGSALNAPSMRVASLEGRASEFASVEIEDAELCPRYMARVVRRVRVAPSPAWLARRLEVIGLRPINNVADITNYVLHELGQPLHAFDLATLTGSKIVVRRARAGEKLKTLDGVERALDEKMLVIADAARPVAIAGVMGGEETEVSGATRDVLIESAYFAPDSVRRTSQVLGLSTDASYRFERGVDREGAAAAQERCVALICEIAGGTATGDAIDIYPLKHEPPTVSLRFERIKSLAALDVSPTDAARILYALGFVDARAKDIRSVQYALLTMNSDVVDEAAGRQAVESSNPTFSTITNQTTEASFVSPTWRMDVEREEDLVEEVARHVGYDKIAEELPASNIAGEYRAGDWRRRAARQAIIAQGYDEAISFSFIGTEHDGLFELLPGLIGDGENESERLVTLSNPIVEGMARMRPSLLPGLLDAVRHNMNHGTRNVRLFELGRVFVAHAEQGSRPEERASLAFAATGWAIEEGRAGASRELDFYDLKGALEAAADAMKAGPLDFAAASARHLREGQTARVLLQGRPVGTLGRLGEELAARYKFRQPVFVGEVDFSALLATPETPVRYMPLARYPSVVRDISLVVGRGVSFAEMKRAALALDLAECRSVVLADVFEGASVPEGKRSVTLRVEYRSDERTLRDEEVEALHARVLESLESNFDAQLRG